MPNVTSIKSRYFAAASGTDRNGICAAQTTGAAGSLTLDGAGVSSGTASFGAGNIAQVTLYTASANTGVNFTVTGTGTDLASQTETIAGPGAGATVTLTNKFTTVTAVSVDAAITGNAEVGWTKQDPQVGCVFAGRTRIRGIQGLSGTTAGIITFNNISITGTTLLTIPTTTTAELIEPYIPDNGILFSDGAYFSAPDAVANGITVFYDG